MLVTDIPTIQAAQLCSPLIHCEIRINLVEVACFVKEGLPDSIPQSSPQQTTDPVEEENSGNPPQSASEGGAKQGQNACSVPHAQPRPPSVNTAKPSTRRLAYEGLARLTDAIRDLAEERRKNILLEESELRDKMRIAKEQIEVGRSKLEDLNRVHCAWAEKIPLAQKAHGRALALRKKAQDAGATTIPDRGGNQHNIGASDEESLWDETFVIAHMNLEFVTNRVTKLRESIAAEEMTLGAGEVKYIEIKEDTNKKSMVLKSEIAKMNALIDFLSHPDNVKGC